MIAVVVGRSYRGSLVILGGVFFYGVVFHIFWLITVESTSRSSKRKGALSRRWLPLFDIGGGYRGGRLLELLPESQYLT